MGQIRQESRTANLSTTGTPVIGVLCLARAGRVDPATGPVHRRLWLSTPVVKNLCFAVFDIWQTAVQLQLGGVCAGN